MTISDRSTLVGFVIHTRKFRDTSLIVEFFDRDQGRCGLLFRGARSSKGKQANVAADLTLFKKIRVQQLSRGELPLAKILECVSGPRVIRGQSSIIGMYVNELIYRLLGPFEAHSEVFDAYESLIESLALAPFDLGRLRRFELLLLAELGYGIDFSYDSTTGQKIQDDSVYQYIHGQGFSSGLGGSGIKFPGHELNVLSKGEMSTAGQKIVKQVVRQAIHHLLDGRGLKSREMLETRG